MRVTATDAKNRFGALCLQAKTGPVVVEKAGEPDTVLLSYADYQRLLRPDAASLAARRKRFNTEHQDWLAAYNQQHDSQGLWNDDLRLW
ncbi:MAG: type II toxin-antitoxin system Phd/YefM family antitoxin [Aquabacterium sp.]|nr:type II toxin-antitoxin system Phd/YefM family antitoxin [Aquabacterium sp.]